MPTTVVPGDQAPPRRLLLPVLGAVLTAASAFGGVLLSAAAGWLNSVCGDSPAYVASQRSSLRRDLLLIWLVVTAAPFAVGAVARARQRPWWPWAVLSCLFLGVAVGAATSAQPGTWCMF